MWRLTADLPDELKKRVMQYIAKNYDSYYGKVKEVVQQALEEFLEKHGTKDG